MDTADERHDSYDVITVLTPGADPVSAEDIQAILLTSGGGIVPLEEIGRWTDTERQLAQDWAIREHLAADGTTILRRPRPSFVDGHRAAAHAALAALAGELRELAKRYEPDYGLSITAAREAIGDCADIAAYEAVQARDGLPCEDTGISHCRACHGADCNPDGPSCGHTAGCPQC